MMSDEVFERRLRELAALAKAQREGPYGPQSDAVASLMAIESLAALLIEDRQAKEKTSA